MRSKETFISERRREQLIEAAIGTLAADGYPATSIAKIAQRAGISKSVALYHFHTKNELMEAVTLAVMTAAAMRIVPAVAAAPTATSKLAAYIRANSQFLADARDQTVALREIAVGYRTPDGRRFDQAVTDDVAAAPPQGDLALLDPVTIFRLGIESREFRSDLDPVAAAAALRGTLDGAAADHARLTDFDPIAFGEFVIDLFTRGVLA